MNMYKAILQAADFIEGHPSQFKFSSVSTPRHPGCGTPGCALGWIGHFAGFSAGEDWIPYDVATKAMGLRPEPAYSGGTLFKEAFHFYRRMDELGGNMWRYRAVDCARALRLYAEKYHALAKPVSPPDWNAIAAKWTVGDDVCSQEVAA